jgi:hypothetical protein
MGAGDVGARTSPCGGKVQFTRNVSSCVRGLIANHNHDLKNIFKADMIAIWDGIQY